MLRFAAVLGIVGFLTGFIAPIYLSDGNQGPLTGIFLTGPGGFVLGLILGAAAWAFGWSRQRQSQVLWSSAAISAALVLFICIPEPRRVGELLDGEIRACGPAQALKAKTVAGWETYAARMPSRTVADWGAKFDKDLAEKPGVVVAIHGTRERGLLQGKAPWNRGQLTSARWQAIPSDYSFFVPGGDCARYAPGLRSVFLIDGFVGRWSPWGISEMLGMREARYMPMDYAALAGAP